MVIITKNSHETQKVAKLLAHQLLKERVLLSSGAVVLAFQGDLGAGKTTFIQGFARGLGIKEKILSPTFVILKKFKIISKKIQNSKFKIQNLYHIDCYRIESPQEILDLGFKEIVTDPRNIIVIEWAERIKKILPKNSWRLEFRWIDKNKREITFKIPKLSVKLKTKSEKQQRKN